MDDVRGRDVEREAAAMRGDQALAWGARAAGVRVVTGYPGSPATGVFDALLAEAGEDVQIGWAPNEKVAMELAFGASLAGARSLVVLKSVGLNVALDPLATMVLGGVRGGMVILLGEDPGAWSSQNEQDSRWAARLAQVPVVEPTDVAQAAAIMAQAYAWSEKIELPVVVRVTPALTGEVGPVEAPWELPPSRLRFWRKRNRWVVLPYTVVKRHRAQHRHLRALRELFEASPYDVACRGAGAERLAIIAVGNMAGKLRDMPGEDGETYDRLALSSVWPLPEESLLTWLAGTRRVLVLEEGSAFVEGELRALLQRAGVDLPVLGRQNGAVPEEGELGQTEIAKALRALDPTRLMPAGRPAEREMPSTQALCPECPYRPTFAALLAAMERHGGRNRHIVIGETGCMVRGNLAPYELFDIKYSLGSGLGVGLGLALSDGRHRPVAVLGDSSFFHSDLNALPYAVQMDAPLTVLVLDNGTTALTGGQPHPGSPADERGRPRPGADLAAAIAGCGIAPRVVELSGGGAASAATELDAALDAALAAEGLAVVIVRGPCPRYVGED